MEVSKILRLSEQKGSKVFSRSQNFGLRRALFEMAILNANLGLWKCVPGWESNGEHLVRARGVKPLDKVTFSNEIRRAGEKVNLGSFGNYLSFPTCEKNVVVVNKREVAVDKKVFFKTSFSPKIFSFPINPETRTEYSIPRNFSKERMTPKSKVFFIRTAVLFFARRGRTLAERHDILFPGPRLL